MIAIDWSDELSAAAIQLLVTVVLGGMVGLFWVSSRRRREGRVAAQEAFYRAYGQWYAVWKEWGATRSTARASLPPGETSNLSSAVPAEALIAKASQVEADLEALLRRVSVERHLTVSERRHLGQFREGAQQLRNSLKAGQKLDWAVQSRDTSRTESYVGFKALSAEFARIVGSRASLSPRTWFPPSLAQAQEALVEITSWRAGPDGWPTTVASQIWCNNGWGAGSRRSC